MPGEPFNSRSMTQKTASTSVSADAPGKVTVTTIDGGATGGYCAIGSCVTATAPITRMNSAMTHAKIGRSIKKRAMHYSCKHADIAFDGRVLESAAVVTVVTAIRPSGLPEPPCCRLYRRFYRKRAALHSKLARTASRAPA